jgi:hypothetical protein
MSYRVHTSCGRDYAVGETYLVYADRDRQSTATTQFGTYSCSRVRSGAERRFCARVSMIACS